MAAEINVSPNETRLITLSSKLEGSADIVRQGCFLPNEDGVVTVSDDRTVRVWLKRDSGQYWPSICHSLPAACTCLSYNNETRRLFIGLNNGTISEFLLSEDYNSISHNRDYLAHSNLVSNVIFSLRCEWLLSCSHDKTFTWHCSETGARLGTFHSSAWCTATEFDEDAKYAFVSSYSGNIHVLKIQADGGCQEVTVLKGHNGSVRCLVWDPVRKFLYSGSFDKSVIAWDIGGQKGVAYELQGHRAKVVALQYSQRAARLLSASDDGALVSWNMSADRTETPDWADSDTCQKCAAPFLWNFRQMWSERTLGTRQHHCRRCGLAVCGACSSRRAVLPRMGYEHPVRVCEVCAGDASEDEKKSLAVFHECKHSIVSMSLDETRMRLLTSGTDRIVKIWDASAIASV